MGLDLDRLRGHGHSIAVNESFRLAPWADILYGADGAWWIKRKDEVATFAGEKWTRDWDAAHQRGIAGLRWTHHAIDRSFNLDPDGGVAGMDSGSNAINLAYLKGARTIVCLGFDMHGNHWHDLHHVAVPQARYALEFLPSLRKMVEPLRQAGARVFNCSPISKVDCFSQISFEDLPLA